MPKKLQEPSEFVSVPVNLLRGLIYSLYQGMEFLQSSYNLAAQLDQVLEQRGKHGQFISNPEGDAADTEPGGEDHEPGKSAR